MVKNSVDNIWLFDYDLTLYGEDERCVLNSLDHRIAEYVQRTVGGSFEHATAIRKEYLQLYGTTLSGLMAVNHIDPDDFFDFIHQPEFLVYPKPSPQKATLLQSLLGRRVVFTNGRCDWSEAGMLAMGIRSCIEHIFDLKQMDWVGKPHESAYCKIKEFLVCCYGKGIRLLPNSSIIMVEDSLRNLTPAHELGWTTILVNPNIDAPDWVDYHVKHLMDLPDIMEMQV